jgi:hypothetical protein
MAPTATCKRRPTIFHHVQSRSAMLNEHSRVQSWTLPHTTSWKYTVPFCEQRRDCKHDHAFLWRPHSILSPEVRIRHVHSSNRSYVCASTRASRSFSFIVCLFNFTSFIICLFDCTSVLEHNFLTLIRVGEHDTRLQVPRPPHAHPQSPQQRGLYLHAVSQDTHQHA